MGSSLQVDPIVGLTAAVLVVGAVLAGLAERTRVPALLLFLALGMVLADDALAVVRFDDAALAQSIAVAALVVILFEGGLGMRADQLRSVLAPAGALATVGVLVTAAAVAGVAWLVLGDRDPTTPLLIGAIVASTDSAAVLSVLRGGRLPRRLLLTLEAESGLNDPAAAMLTIGLIATWEGTATTADWVTFVVVQLVGGVLVGVVVGATVGWLLRRAPVSDASLSGLFALGAAAGTYALAAALGASGFLAVYLCGVLVGSAVPRRQRSLLALFEGLAGGAQLAVFTVLGLLVFPSELPGVAVPALIITAGLVLLGRPLAVLVSYGPFRPPRSHLVFASWAGLRGAVPIVLATFPFLAGHPDSQLIFDVVFFVVLVSVALQGASLGWVGARLGLRADATGADALIETVPLDGGGELVELEVPEGSPLVGRRLADTAPPLDSRVAVVLRDGATIVPDGSTRPREGDVLVFVLAHRVGDAPALLRAWASASVP